MPREIACDFRPKFSKNFRGRNILRSNSRARDRAEIHAMRWCAACSRPLEVPNICAEGRYAALRGIVFDFEPISDRKVRKKISGRKILRSKGPEIA